MNKSKEELATELLQMLIKNSSIRLRGGRLEEDAKELVQLYKIIWEQLPDPAPSSPD